MFLKEGSTQHPEVSGGGLRRTSQFGGQVEPLGEEVDQLGRVAIFMSVRLSMFLKK